MNDRGWERGWSDPVRAAASSSAAETVGPGATELGRELRREAAEVPVGPPPTDRVVARGRRSRRRRHAATGLVAAAMVGAVAVAIAPVSDHLGGGGTGPTVAAPAAPASTTVVEPGVPVEIGHGQGLALWRDGSHLVAPLDTFADRDGPPSTATAEPLTSSFTPTGTGVVGTGTWRGEPAVARLTVSVNGQEQEAALVTLPGEPGWGAYHLDLPEPPSGELTVTAYGEDGTVLSQLAEGFPP
ncbi:hypothetical protein [Streptomyces profundus]|uniref:hypothetical protein n=1 Tax=Streptomyces profundus TaxID=2867410 RepID=UPI001D16E2EA|nr:hypothetical protein [Streptomyces sp. MA3_2.13]UED86168.1 hypothetical protein K4G22_19875 [Streptomyces sp. MA3_2.13]